MVASHHGRGIGEGFPWAGGVTGTLRERSCDQDPAYPGNFPCGLDWPLDHIPDLTPPEVVGSRLQLYEARWASLSNDAWVTSVIRRGFRILFKEKVPLTTCRPVFQRNYADGPRRRALLNVIADYVQKGAVFRLVGNPGPGFYSRVFLVPKRSRVDLHLLNQFTLVDSFKMESVNSISLALRRGEWATSVDLADAYLHIPMHPLSWRYLRFALDGEVYEFRSLPFGLATAPYCFTRVMKTVSSCCHRAGLRFHAYLDYSLCPASNRRQCL